MDASGTETLNGTGLELFTREARRSGRLVVALRCTRRGDGVVVECDAYHVAEPAVAGPKRRAFAFRDSRAAERFAAEMLRALEYLGCNVT
jgi:hypothetical protein